MFQIDPMALEALPSTTDLLNLIIYETLITATPPQAAIGSGNPLGDVESCSSSVMMMQQQPATATGRKSTARAGTTTMTTTRKKRRRRPKRSKNEEEAEAQRMMHIAVERNRRKQMNEHLAVLRSLMPHSYVQRGDQASIVGGAIQFVKELEHRVQSLEAQKLQIRHGSADHQDSATAKATGNGDMFPPAAPPPRLPFSGFFTNPQYTCLEIEGKFMKGADIEVILIETHANIRILTRKRFRAQLSKLVACFQTLHLNILHLNVTTTSDPLLLCSISAKVEEGCVLSSADEIASAVHHMLAMIGEEATLCPTMDF